MGLGTDVAPHNLVEEMRLAIILARVMAGSIRTADTGEMFRAATAGGAAALGRDDLGRLAPGARADIVLVDLDHPAMRPARDPLRTFVFEAADRAVRDVFVDGRPVVENGEAPASRPGAGRGRARRVAGPDARGRTPARLSRTRRGNYRALFASPLSRTGSETGHTCSEPTLRKP